MPGGTGVGSIGNLRESAIPSVETAAEVGNDSARVAGGFTLDGKERSGGCKTVPAQPALAPVATAQSTALAHIRESAPREGSPGEVDLSLPSSLPYAKGSPTSEAAAVSMESHAAKQRAQVLATIASFRFCGVTDEEGQICSEIPGSSWRPRRGELAKSSWSWNRAKSGQP